MDSFPPAARNSEVHGCAHRFRHAYVVAFILLFTYTISFVDRQVIGLLVQPIKRDLGLSDTAFSLLSGFSFAFFYATVGLVMGWAADRSNRRNLILIGVLVWTFATFSSAYATSFTILMLARVSLAIGESVLNPAAYSMLADYFPIEQRARGISIYSTGVYIGSAMAFLLGGVVMGSAGDSETISLGVLGTFKPWQATFAIASLPGVLAFLLMLFVQEPQRHRPEASPNPLTSPANSLQAHRKSTFKVLAPVMLAFGVTAIITYGLAVWLPAAFIRNWGWTPANFGLTYGLILLSFGVGGMLCAGQLSDHLFKRGNKSAAFDVLLWSTTLVTGSNLFFSLASTAFLAMTSIAATTFLLGMTIALAPTVLLAVTPVQMRGRIIASAMFIINMIGLGLGPSAVAFITDHVFRDEMMVHASLGIVITTAGLLSAICLASIRSTYCSEVFWRTMGTTRAPKISTTSSSAG